METIIPLFKDCINKLTYCFSKKLSLKPVPGVLEIGVANVVVEQNFLPLGAPAQWGVNIQPALVPTNPPAKFPASDHCPDDHCPDDHCEYNNQDNEDNEEDPDNGGLHTAHTNKRYWVPESAANGVLATEEDVGDEDLHMTPANKGC
ncbi:hypothetical protein HOY80DRAFT_1048557 [Tuber brumale]|nr:hypothetical protein HOY80DRAFT_1048557 [Tuber brumale]